MNKNILKLIFSICLAIILLLYICAEENITNSNDSYIEGVLQEQNNIQTDLSETIEANLSENTTNLSEGGLIYIEENVANPEEIIISDSEKNETHILPEETSSGTPNHKESSDKIIEYAELTEINQTISETNSKIINEEGQKEESICLLYNSLGKKVIEVNECNEENLLGIGVQELEKGEFKKEVTISSQEHFDAPLRVYTSLTSEAEEEDIQVYWKNEGDLEITGIEDFSLEYYDENENGLVDKISWVVPHLSEQIFEIVIEMNKSNESTSGILLTVNNPPSGEVNNPIIFDIDVDYSGNFSCQLEIGGNSSDVFPNQIYNMNLPNGNYNWGVACFDTINPNITNATSGNFSVNEGFSVGLSGGDFSSTGERMYFLDLVKNNLKSNGTATIHSENPSNVRVELRKENNLYYAQNITLNGSDYSLPLNKTLLNQAGTYNLTAYFGGSSARNVTSTLFYVVSANLSFNTTQIQEGQSVRVTTTINSPLEKITTISVYYGDGGVNVSQINSEGNRVNYFDHKYTAKGGYSVDLIAYIGTATLEIQKNGITVTEAPNGIDDDSPSINLMEPNDEDIIRETTVNFTYKASDNVKIQNCTFKLYENCASMNYCSTSESNLAFPLNSQQRAIANNYSVLNNKEVEIGLKDFEDGIYEWIVECYDNSSNYDWEISFFEIRVNGSSGGSSGEYEQQEEIDLLKEQADDFLSKSFSLEEKEVLDELNILNDTKYYKKRLLDIENFFKENYKYVSSEALKKQKTEDYIQELEEIKNKIPKSITIQDTKEYIKNSVDVSLEEIIKEYFESTNTKISKSSIKKLVKINKELQNEISVSVKAKNVEIEYENGTQKITLVRKGIELNDDSYNKMLEIIPKNVAESADEIIFLTENKVINEDPLFEIDYSDLENEEIVYYLQNQINLKDIEKTETLLFEDDLTNFEAGFTGFFIIEFISEDFTLYIIIAFILLVALLFIIPFVFRKFRIISWKREPNVAKTFNLIEDIKRFLKEKEIEKARETYYKIKEIYPVLPANTKKYFYEKIKEMLIRIDRKDIFNLVKEYQEAKRKWNKEDYMRLYEDIKKIYERLPEKDRKKVYSIINGY